MHHDNDDFWREICSASVCLGRLFARDSPRFCLTGPPSREKLQQLSAILLLDLWQYYSHREYIVACQAHPALVKISSVLVLSFYL